MSKLDILITEITTDPLGRNYSAMTNEEVAESLNVRDRNILDSVISSAMIFNAIEPSEYQALANTKLVDLLLGVGEQIDVGPGTNARTVILNSFGGGSTTVANLVTAATKLVSRGVELELGIVRPGHVEEARRV